MAYWRTREGPLPSSDSRDYSDEAWARADEEARRLCNRFPLPHGTALPLTPLTPIELQAALILPDAEGRAALLRTLEYFGATRARVPTADEDDEVILDDDEIILDVPCGVGVDAPRAKLPGSRASLDELARAAAACLAEADVLAHAELDPSTRALLEPRAAAAAPNGSELLTWLDDAWQELALIRRWRARTPGLDTARQDAAALTCYLLYKNPYGHGVTAPLPAARATALMQWLSTHRHERDDRAVLDVVAALEAHAPRTQIEPLLDRLTWWLRLSQGLVMA